MLRSTIAVPILAGRNPPQLPAAADWNDKSWLHRGKNCAEYYMTLFVPWNVDNMHLVFKDFNFDGFKTLCSSMQSPDASFINKCRYASINTLATPVANASQK